MVPLGRMTGFWVNGLKCEFLGLQIYVDYLLQRSGVVLLDHLLLSSPRERAWGSPFPSGNCGTLNLAFNSLEVAVQKLLVPSALSCHSVPGLPLLPHGHLGRPCISELFLPSSGAQSCPWWHASMWCHQHPSQGSRRQDKTKKASPCTLWPRYTGKGYWKLFFCFFDNHYNVFPCTPPLLIQEHSPFS